MLKLPDGTVIAQQRAILRLISKQAGLYPVDPLAAAKVDELMDAAEDLQTKVNAAGQGLEQAEKEAKRKEACESGVVFDLVKKMDEYIAKNGSGGCSVGDKISCADLMIFTTSCGVISGMFDGVPATTFDQFKSVQAVRKAVANHPAVKAYHDTISDINPIGGGSMKVKIGCHRTSAGRDLRPGKLVGRVGSCSQHSDDVRGRCDTKMA
eukprot:2349385-Rhodomonas_salina.4